MDTYSLENARRFEWSSVTGKLNPERLSYLQQLVGENFLDAGCAGGAYSEYLRTQGFNVIGIDKTAEFLNDISDDRQQFYKQADITDLPFADNHFDSAYCFDVLEHVDDAAALKELIRVTRYRLIITVPHENYDVLQKCSLTLLPYQDTTHLRYYNTDSLSQLIRSLSIESFNISGEIPVPIRYLCSELIKGENRQPSFSYLLRKLMALLVKAILYVAIKPDPKLYSSLVAVIEVNKLPLS